MFGKLLLIFILVPLADLILLLVIADYTSWSFSIAIVILSGIIGAWLAQQSGRSVGRKIQDQLRNQAVPTELLTDGAMILFAAGLLLTPGFITDTIGLSLLIPACRRWYKKGAMTILKKHFKVQVVQVRPDRTPPADPNVVDGEVVSSTESTGEYDEGLSGNRIE